MGKVQFTQDAENERVRREQESRSSQWSLLQTTSLVKALHFARDNGWKENKVQVREEEHGGIPVFYVEPYEEGCGCRGMLKYKQYFD